MSNSKITAIPKITSDSEKAIRLGFTITYAKFRERLVSETEESIPSEVAISEYFKSYENSAKLQAFLAEESERVMVGFVKILLGVKG